MKTVGKKVIIIIIIIIVLISLIVIIINSKKKQNNVEEPLYEINNIILDNFDLKKEHCIGSLCIKNLTINYSKNDISSIHGTVYNNSLETINKCFKIIFNNSEDNPFVVASCYSDLAPQDESIYEYQFDYDINSIINIDNYELIEISKEEFIKIRQSQ